MAESPSHRFGQIIGEMLEEAIKPLLRAVAQKHGLFLDSKQPRKSRGGKRKVSWVDIKGNNHDLDYVLEQGGTEESTGIPKAFIEIAWRRYTKHSRNKAQEIQGAITPLAERFRDAHPFLGVVLAGEFTEPSLNQLRSHHFEIVYFPYKSVVAAFAVAGVNATVDEGTPDAEVRKKVDAYEALDNAGRERIANSLRTLHRADLDRFAAALEKSLTRTIESVFVLPLHGSPHVLTSVAEAIAFVETFSEGSSIWPISKYEVQVRYSNSDEIRGQFQDKRSAIQFLSTFR
jgi:hypothetical protein